MQKISLPRTTGLFAAACTLALATAGTAVAQSVRIPIYVTNARDLKDTLILGVEPGATLGIDKPLGEEEFPPFPPTQVFHSRFITPSGHPTDPPSGLGEGTKVDIRPWVGATQADTFRIRFQPGENGSPVVFSWPANLGGYATEMKIRIAGEMTDMLTTTSVTVTDQDVTTATIYKVGTPTSAVEEAAGMATYGFWLRQNEPNPVRASQGTVIRYRITRPSKVSLRLYDALGRMVTSVVDADQAADLYTVNLATEGLTPGVYYYTLIAGQFQASRSLVVVE